MVPLRLQLLRALLLIGLAGQPSFAQSTSIYARIDIDEIGPQRLEAIRSNPGVEWWMELDSWLLVLAREEALPELERAERVEILDLEPHQDRLRILQRAHDRSRGSEDYRWLAQGGRYAVVQLVSGESGDVDSHRLLPFRPNLVLARQRANERDRAAAAGASALIQALVDRVDPQRWFDDVEALASFNRYTHGPGVLDARDWVEAQFQTIPELTVTTESFQVGATTAYNVIATRLGSGAPDRWVLIGGHYDSTSEIPNQTAPGGEDNASGCAGVLELARVLTESPAGATMIFACYSGEEQGLHGSADHAASLVASGDDDKILAMLNMDMIGYSADSVLDCLLETSSAHAALLEPFVDAAAVYTDLRIVTSLFAFGSDHVPYLDRGMPALLTIEDDWDIYPHYHRSTDLPTNLSLAMGGEILRMNVGAMAGMSHGILFVDGFESGDTLRWGG